MEEGLFHAQRDGVINPCGQRDPGGDRSPGAAAATRMLVRHRERAPEHVGLASEMLLPQLVRNSRGQRPQWSVLLGGESAAQLRLDPQDAQQDRGRVTRAHSCGSIEFQLVHDQPHSVLSASIGSSLAARRAGNQLASTAATSKNNKAPIRVIGSAGVMW